MKRGFTLVEMLVVVVVIAILATVAFRLTSIGTDANARNTTVARMQRLENCLSGYYAAFGSYPPVQLHGSRNYLYPVNEFTGVQILSRGPNSSIDLSKESAWPQVEAACRSQPVRTEYPYATTTVGGGSDSTTWATYISLLATTMQNHLDDAPVGVRTGKRGQVIANGFDALENPSSISDRKRANADWSVTQVFKFGLLSYFIPRYLVMMGHEDNALYDDFEQWGDNNTIPSQFENGAPYKSWGDLNNDVRNSSDRRKIKMLPSQAVTARWLPSLEHQLTGPKCSVNVYGIELMPENHGKIEVDWYLPIYSAGEGDEGYSQPYTVDYLTCEDGWYNTYYYYSKPPYQSYRLWSAGPNGKTFPPWISQEEIEDMGAKNGNIAKTWLMDDIVHMSN